VLGAALVITVAAAGLRLAALGPVPLDPFYDAAVRSMSQSLHNFFFGVYEPGGSVAIDKPPIDLWLQVISVKLFGFGSVALKLPQAVAGTLAVPVLYDAVRRVFGDLAGLASAAVLAVLPIAVLTARSDTMDAVMMLLSVLALWLLVRYAGERSPRYLYLAAAAMGVAFNVKLFQGLVGLPALALLALVASGERRWRRLAGAGVVFVVVALSWLLATLAFSNRPFAIGSTNGSAWNAAFVFNGYDRIAKPASQPDLSGTDTGARRRPAGNSELQRAAVPIGTPAPLRLFDHDGPLSGLRLGYLLLTALLLGVPALVASLLPASARGRRVGPPAGRPERAMAAGVLLWLATGVVLFSVMARLHPRYTEAFNPAVAAAAGIGLAFAVRGGLAGRVLAGVCALGLAVYGHYLLGGSSLVWLLTGLAAAAALAAAILPVPGPVRRLALGGALGAAALLLPVHVAIGLVQHAETDAGHVGVMRPGQAEALSAYLGAHRQGARYELAVGSATQAAALIVRDGEPVLVLTSFDARPLVDVPRLAGLVADGSVRYALLGGGCGPRASRKLASCSGAAFWVRAHGQDVSRAAGLDRPRLLWRLGAGPSR
jgi:4-amino-4-deoxy-L-arabinose transferase-like glycosyltransferase